MKTHLRTVLVLSLVAVLSARGAALSTPAPSDKPAPSATLALKSSYSTGSLTLVRTTGTLYLGSTSLERPAPISPPSAPVDATLFRFDQKLEAITAIKATGGIQRANPGSVNSPQLSIR